MFRPDTSPRLIFIGLVFAMLLACLLALQGRCAIAVGSQQASAWWNVASVEPMAAATTAAQCLVAEPASPNLHGSADEPTDGPDAPLMHPPMARLLPIVADVHTSMHPRVHASNAPRLPLRPPDCAPKTASLV